MIIIYVLCFRCEVAQSRNVSTAASPLHFQPTSASTRWEYQEGGDGDENYIRHLPPGGCPDSLPQSGKKVFCYYEGKKSPRSIDPCPCTHLLYKNVPISGDSRVLLGPAIAADLAQLTQARPGLAVLLSIGGESVTSDTFRAIVSRCCCCCCCCL